jgi:hypothetical protein
MDAPACNWQQAPMCAELATGRAPLGVRPETRSALNSVLLLSRLSEPVPPRQPGSASRPCAHAMERQPSSREHQPTEVPLVNAPLLLNLVPSFVLRVVVVERVQVRGHRRVGLELSSWTSDQ